MARLPRLHLQHKGSQGIMRGARTTSAKPACPPLRDTPIRGMSVTYPRLGVRAVLLHENRLLLVNAWPGEASALWCAPGGGVERGTDLPGNLRRELAEETGLDIEVGAPCLVNEFHDPLGSFHQVEVFFRCRLASALPHGWPDNAPADPSRIVTRRRFFARDELADLRLKPDALPAVAWGEGLSYDPLEPITR